jgi:FkbM family methyltransferase
MHHLRASFLMSTRFPWVILKRPVQFLRYFRLFSNWRGVLNSRFGSGARPDFVYQFRDGRRLISPYPDGPYFIGEVVVNETYSPLKRFRDAAVVWDIGANVGTFTIWASSYMPGAQFVSFEPAADTYEVLSRNRELNGNINWTLHPFGMGKVSQTIIGHRPSGTFRSGGSSMLRDDGTPVPMEIRNINEVWRSMGCPVVDVMKIDCEGAEYELMECIDDQLLASVRGICMEVHPYPGCDYTKIVKRLEDAGFSVGISEGTLFDLHAIRLLK